MRYRLLGHSGLRVSEVFLGAMTFADGFVHGAGRDEAQRIVDAYAGAGGNVIDTAINYRDGASEEIVGEVLNGRRERYVLATKYGVSCDRDDPNAAGSHRKNLRLSLETSLRRLRTDYIDLYYVHLGDPPTPNTVQLWCRVLSARCVEVACSGRWRWSAVVAVFDRSVSPAYGWPRGVSPPYGCRYGELTVPSRRPGPWSTSRDGRTPTDTTAIS